MPMSTVSRRRLHLLEAGCIDRHNLPEFETIDGTTRFHSFRGCGDKTKVWRRRFSCFCSACIAHNWAACSTRTLIGEWNEQTQSYCNDWVEEKIVQVKGRGVAQARLDEKKAEEDEAKEFATRLVMGQWIAVDCNRDEDGFGFWLGKAAGPSYVSESKYKNGETEIEVGDHLVDVDYFSRVSVDSPLDFVPDPVRETAHANSVLPVPDLVVEMFGLEGRNARLAHASSVRVMEKYKLVQGRSTGRKKAGRVV